MIINALNTGATRLHGRPRGLAQPRLGEHRHGPGDHPRRASPDADLHEPRGQALPAGRARRPRSSCGRAAGTSSSGTSWSTARPVSATLFDFGLFLFHGGRAALERGSGPYLYLPKLESHLEARLWNDVFVAGQDALGIPRGSIRATVLIETILAAFEMDEILYELREHAAGLNAGRWDYIFSIIKKFRARPGHRPARPRPGDHGRALHARLHAAPRAHLPPARRARHRRHVRLHPQPPRAGGDGQRAGQGARGQGARGGRRLRRHLGRPSRPRAGGHGGLRPAPRRAAEPEGPPARGRRSSTRPTCST